MIEEKVNTAHLSTFEDLITTRDEVRAGFIKFALEKNRRSSPYIDQAKSLKAIALTAKKASDLKRITEIRGSLLTASGLSDKALVHLTENDMDKAIDELIENFLNPAGENFVDELVFRYLLIQGDALGGSMRNIVGAIAMQRMTRALLAALNNANIRFQWLDGRSKKKEWLDGTKDDYTIDSNLKAITWTNKGKNRLFMYNMGVPFIKNNIDMILLNAKPEELQAGIISKPERFVMLGELKGGIDPAGADEHWKTANSALERIRRAFKKKTKKVPKILFVAAAIENKMAMEIWTQLRSKKINNAANLTHDTQIAHVCNWIINL